MYQIFQTPTITAGAYGAGNAVGGKLTFSGCPEDGCIETISIIDVDDVGAELNLVLFRKDFTSTTDNAAFDITAGEEDWLIGIVNFAAADYKDLGGLKVATKGNLGLGYYLTETDTTKKGRIYAQLSTPGTPSYTSTTGLRISLAVEKD
jgi:hypothetical protein